MLHTQGIKGSSSSGDEFVRQRELGREGGFQLVRGSGEGRRGSPAEGGRGGAARLAGGGARALAAKGNRGGAARGSPRREAGEGRRSSSLAPRASPPPAPARWRAAGEEDGGSPWGLML
ncbi:hypothetical protein GQ55_3G347500 [Panicum hallii var. hallii]|uniref:Uncharacterized protein n=1 Tax=Panicum hallii var. hallii TaxID=1504633 RepID=A0A2T7EFR5_9POAL|nr:hypothetical protein GQ55_3G347500 [Panicum hallii var. hallii]